MTQMLLKKSKEHHDYWEPADERDLTMFSHCTDGCIACTYERLERHRGVFAAHGIEIKIQTN